MKTQEAITAMRCVAIQTTESYRWDILGEVWKVPEKVICQILERNGRVNVMAV